jgi:CSLREA domain-containing protein
VALRTTFLRASTALLAILASLSLVLLGPAFPAQAQSSAIITVDTTDDNSDTTDGKCSLREAITNANDNAQTSPDCQPGSDGAQDIIVFGDGVSGTITLDGDVGRLHITDPKGLAIDGASSGITISGGDTTGVFQVDSGSDLTLNKLMVVHGAPAEAGSSVVGGGGVVNNGKLTTTNSTFSQNTTGLRGGAIYSVGQLRVVNSTFSGNSAREGGAISSPDNQGTAEVSGTTFSGNSADDQGGAIDNQGALSVSNSTFSTNNASAGGGIASGGTGTIINGHTYTAELFLTNSTFSGNSASLGNGGGGISSATLGSVKATNTILAKSPASANCVGTVNDGGYNISSDASCAFSQPTSKNSKKPKLAKRLADNGGPTQTIALLKGSPALNAIPQGQSGCGTNITTDQRGITRPQGSGCDIGAYEKQVKLH